MGDLKVCKLTFIFLHIPKAYSQGQQHQYLQYIHIQF